MCWLLKLRFTKDLPEYKSSYAPHVLHFLPSCSRLIIHALSHPHDCGRWLLFHIYDGGDRPAFLSGFQALSTCSSSITPLEFSLTSAVNTNLPRFFTAISPESPIHQEPLGQCGPSIKTSSFLFLRSAVSKGLNAFLPFFLLPFLF